MTQRVSLSCNKFKSSVEGTAGGRQMSWGRGCPEEAEGSEGGGGTGSVLRETRCLVWNQDASGVTNRGQGMREPGGQHPRGSTAETGVPEPMRSTGLLAGGGYHLEPEECPNHALPGAGNMTVSGFLGRSLDCP